MLELLFWSLRNYVCCFLVYYSTLSQCVCVRKPSIYPHNGKKLVFDFKNSFRVKCVFLLCVYIPRHSKNHARLSQYPTCLTKPFFLSKKYDLFRNFVAIYYFLRVYNPGSNTFKCYKLIDSKYRKFPGYLHFSHYELCIQI